MERCPALPGVAAVDPLAVLHLGEHITIPVQHPAGQKGAGGGVEVAVEGGGRPFSAVFEEQNHKDGQARGQDSGDEQADPGPAFDLTHREHLASWDGQTGAACAAEWQSWR